MHSTLFKNTTSFRKSLRNYYQNSKLVVNTQREFGHHHGFRSQLIRHIVVKIEREYLHSFAPLATNQTEINASRRKQKRCRGQYRAELTQEFIPDTHSAHHVYAY